MQMAAVAVFNVVDVEVAAESVEDMVELEDVGETACRTMTLLGEIYSLLMIFILISNMSKLSRFLGDWAIIWAGLPIDTIEPVLSFLGNGTKRGRFGEFSSIFKMVLFFESSCGSLCIDSVCLDWQEPARVEGEEKLKGGESKVV